MSSSGTLYIPDKLHNSCRRTRESLGLGECVLESWGRLTGVYWDIGSLLLNVHKLWGKASVFERHSRKLNTSLNFEISWWCVCVCTCLLTHIILILLRC